MARVNILNFTHVAEICEKSEYQLKYHQGKMKIAAMNIMGKYHF